MLTNQGLARLQSFQRSAARVAVSRATVKGTYTTQTKSYLSTRTLDNGITVIRHESGLTASAFPDGSHLSGTASVWRVWSKEQRAKELES